MYKEVKF